MKLLIIEDDDALRDVLARTFEEAGYVVDAAADGLQGEARTGEDVYDAIVLDLMMPGRSGLDVLRGWRADGIATPVLVLTALGSEGDTVTGLDAGADDYVRKPFGIAELKARVRAIVRRERSAVPLPALAHGSVRLDLASRRATRNQRELQLTLRETAFLEYFLRNERRAISRDMLVAALWPSEAELGSNVIDVHVRRLRGKLHGPGEPPVLHTVHGIGYRLEER